MNGTKNLVVVEFCQLRDRQIQSVESSASGKPDFGAEAWIVVESATDTTAAPRAATSCMIDLQAAPWTFNAEYASLGVQRHASAAEPGCERADVYRQRGHAKVSSATSKNLLTLANSL